MLKKFVKTSVIVGAVVAALGVTTQVDAASCGTITASSLYVRSGASTSHKVLGTVSKGKTVQIKDTQDGWHKISYNGDHGWVSGKYVSTTSSSTGGTTSGSTSTGTTQTTKTGTITAFTLDSYGEQFGVCVQNGNTHDFYWTSTDGQEFEHVKQIPGEVKGLIYKSGGSWKYE